MSDALKKVTRGESLADLIQRGEGPFNAAWFNQSVDAIQDANRARRTLDGAGAKFAPPPLDRDDYFLNNSGADLDQYAIVGLGGLIDGPTSAPGTFDDAEQLFRDETNWNSAAPAPGQPFGITREPIPSLEIGRALLTGRSKCRVLVNNVNDRFAGPIAGNYTHLSSSSTGPAEILWPRPFSATGERWAIVRLNATWSGIGFTTGTGIPAATFSTWGMGLINDYRLNADGTLTALGTSRLIYSMFGGGIPGPLTGGAVPIAWALDGASGLPYVTMAGPQCVAVTDACNNEIASKNLMPSLTCPQCGTSSGTGSGGGSCPCVSTVWCVSFPGVTNGSCSSCALLTNTIRLSFDTTISAALGGACVWTANVELCPGAEPQLITLLYVPSSHLWQLTVHYGGIGTLGDAVYTVTQSGSDCVTPIVLTSLGGFGTSQKCNTYPATATATPCGTSGGKPTITPNSTNICSDATSLTITGTNFTSPASGNVVTLTDHGGANVANTVATGTSTSLTLTLTSPPIANLGELDAVVSNANGTSTSAQVADVIACAPVITSLGTAHTSVSTTSMVIGGINPQAGLLVVNIGWLTAGSWSPTVAFNGVAMALAEQLGFVVTLGGVSQYYLAVPAGTASVTITNAVAFNAEVEIINVTGLALNALDQVTDNNDFSGTTAPDTSATATTTAVHEACLAVFFMKVPGGAWTWAGTPTFTSGGQDVTQTYSGSSYSLSEGRYVASSLLTLDAALTGVTPVEWTSILATYQ